MRSDFHTFDYFFENEAFWIHRLFLDLSKTYPEIAENNTNLIIGTSYNTMGKYLIGDLDIDQRRNKQS